MKTLKTNRTLAFLGMLAVASCDDGTPTDPAVEELFTLAETIELDVLASTGSIDVALELADASNIVASNRGDVLYGHALRMAGSQDDAADLVQRALVQGFQKLRTCRDPDRVGAWLFRILANLCKDHVCSSRRSDISLNALAGLLRGRSDPALDAEGADVWDALDALTPEQREAFVLKHVEGRSYEEIAAVMDLSVASLKMRVYRARHALRGLLEEYA